MQPPLEIVELTLTEHLTLERLEAAVAAANLDLAKTSSPVGLLVDCTGMKSYDTDARQRFVTWSTATRPRVRRLVVVTERPLWHMVVAGMALASGQAMKAFSDRNSALAWLIG